MADSAEICDLMQKIHIKSRDGGKSASQCKDLLKQLDEEVDVMIDRLNEEGEYQPMGGSDKDEESEGVCKLLNDTIITSLRTISGDLRIEIEAQLCLAEKSIFTRDVLTSIKADLSRTFESISEKRLFNAAMTDLRPIWPHQNKLWWSVKPKAYTKLCVDDDCDVVIDNDLILRYHNCLHFTVMRFCVRTMV